MLPLSARIIFLPAKGEKFGPAAATLLQAMPVKWKKSGEIELPDF
jgi:hypothetical protein